MKIASWQSWATASHRPGAHLSHTHVTMDAWMEDLVYLDRGT
ncbi:hypothetical protein E2C01_065681 [Portunus trituberculatus]|uniref:Uncharacterized protein n=1 Tax=Portunus trituberculatus TaxID=210409 RepID=A0A5B7HMR2_PORTR|nr:hypothetical protein [Portunus trituberculatus]